VPVAGVPGLPVTVASNTALTLQLSSLKKLGVPASFQLKLNSPEGMTGEFEIKLLKE